MIGWLSGQIIDKTQPGKLTLNVSGVGYDVETSLNTFFQVESLQTESVHLHIHTVVREDALLLYGFTEKMERSLFRALIKVNGVGPKAAITILSSTRPDEFIHCIQQEDTVFLTKLPGIGKKTAERLVVEMKDSLDKIYQSDSTVIAPSRTLASNQEEAISALTSLGYKYNDAKKVMNLVDDGEKSCEQLIRQSLQKLASR